MKFVLGMLKVNEVKRLFCLHSYIALPPGFYAQQAFQDAMAIARMFGKPDYFIIFTRDSYLSEFSLKPWRTCSQQI